MLEVADVVAGDDIGAQRDRHRALELGADGEDRRAAPRRPAAAARARTRATGAAPAVRPLGVARTTESSQRMWMPRSWPSTPSTSGAKPRRRASSSSWAIGSSLRLPLVITSGRPTPASSRWCSGEYGSSTPRSGKPGRHPGRDAARRRVAARSRSGARRRRAPRRPRRSARKGRSARRRGRRPSPRTACRRAPCGGAARPPPPSSVASTARWKPPMPLTATIAPARSAATAASSAASPSRRLAADPSVRAQRRRGPHAGQALGWAWKRRSRRVVVLRLAGRAHGEAGHGRGRAVVRDRAHDRVAGAAVGAVGERVAVASVGRVVDLGEARRAGGGVDAHRRAGRVAGRRSR